MYLELTPLQALVWCAEDVINTWAEILPCDGQTREPWVLDLERLKEKLRSGVHFILQTLRAVSTYHHNYNKASYRCLRKMKRAQCYRLKLPISCSVSLVIAVKIVFTYKLKHLKQLKCKRGQQGWNLRHLSSLQTSCSQPDLAYISQMILRLNTYRTNKILKSTQYKYLPMK